MSDKGMEICEVCEKTLNAHENFYFLREQVQKGNVPEGGLFFIGEVIKTPCENFRGSGRYLE